MRQPTHTQRRHHAQPGFTLVELLVVITIMAVIAAMALPFISSMARGNRMSNTVATVSTAVASARRFATQLTSPRSPGDSGITGDDGSFPDWGPATSDESGVALIVSPTGEMRLTVNDTTLRYDGSLGASPTFMEDKNSSGDHRNGFVDIEGDNFDYIKLPASVQIKGIIRTGSSPGETYFIDPPFAIRFDTSGRLVASTTMSNSNIDPRVVYYFHDKNLSFRENKASHYSNVSTDARPISGTPSPDPAVWEQYYYHLIPNQPDTYVVGGSGGTEYTFEWDPDLNKYKLPFGRMVSVPGVRIIDPDTGEYKDIFFSRYTGESLVSQ